MRTMTLAAVAAFAIDQTSKYAVVFGLELWRVRSMEILPPLLTFRYGENRGINFGLFGGGSEVMRWLLVAIALTICVAVAAWVRRTEMGRPARICAGLLIGGALANVLDRVIYGFVLDFLNMSCCGIHNPFVFNLADVFIFAGALGLVLFAPDGKRPAEKGQ